ncbi:bifunctional lysylphosphatidylglycerol flippase/synthetase MprF [Amycolatopsis sp. FDAARGOS 1241]|uniref:bifunctional lysylphosphatidylglycerol flippase/synthetase MprF n=1 Tax=Amycolatopsis sp. FDAARGOS 1241 TaxID=2778070 RepID=UPI00194E4629|nr:DUF2156 domain-containing protein [Amycolatopsis sp. FDAARGOS 1241]QRP49279.1 DUF2156 domain-containing protein [Amycolatopsis sp. FDAARGOS 1241]
MAQHAAAVEPARQPEFLGRVRSIALLLWRRAPFTTAVVLVMVVAGLATGSLWSAVESREWFPLVSYGLPSLENGRWWTFLTGPFFALTPIFYLPVAGGFALLVGPAEARMGTRRTAAIAVGAQLAATLGAALVLLGLRSTGWAWAGQLAERTDVGFSAGALAVVAVVSATIRSPWRLRLRALLCVYVGVSILYVGTLADLEHLLAVGLTLPLARRLAGPRRVRSLGRPSRREWRLLAVTGLAVAGAVQVVVRIAPGPSPLGSTAGQADSIPELAIVLIVIALMINGLRRGKRAAWRWAVGLASLIVALGVVIAVLVVIAEIFGLAYTIENAPFLVADAVLWGAELTLLLAARSAFRVPSRRKRRRALGTRDVDTATELLQRHGGGTLSWMTTWPENYHFFPDDESYLAYHRHAGVAIALGDPIGAVPGTITAFSEACDSAGLIPCLFSVTEETIAFTGGLGWSRVQVAEDTIVDLENLEFRGKAWQNVRSALNRAKKEGIAFRLVTLADEPWSLVAQVRAISEEWVGDKGMPEMGFTLGGVDEALDPRTRVGLALDPGGVVHGVTSWLPVYCGDGRVGGWTLDVMRRRADGFRPVVEFLIASSCQQFRDEGARVASLSGAPLARAPEAPPAGPLERLLDSFGGAMEPYYGFRSLHTFKMKFNPRYVPMYLAYREEADLPRIGVALTRAYLPDASLGSLVRMGKS